MITENLSTLKIYNLTQEQYDRELADGNIDPNSLYLTPEEEIDLSSYATTETVTDQVDTHNTSEEAHSDIRKLITDLQQQVGDDPVSEQIDGKFSESITSLSVDGKTITYTMGDGKTTGTITTQDTVYTHPTHTAKDSGLYKITVDGTGHVSETAAVEKADILALGISESGVYVQTDEPADAEDGAVWIDTDANATGSSIAVTSGSDYAQNDPFGAGYIKNRPCYFTGNILKTEYASFVNGATSATVDCLMVDGDTYRILANGSEAHSKEFVAKKHTLYGETAYYIGDNIEAYETQGESFVPTYGFIVYSIQLGSDVECVVEVLSQELMLETFGLTVEDVVNGSSFNIIHLKPEVVKLDKRFLPDDINFGGAGNNIKIIDTNNQDITTIDFSQFSAGDIILAVSDLAGGGV